MRPTKNCSICRREVIFEGAIKHDRGYTLCPGCAYGALTPPETIRRFYTQMDRVWHIEENTVCLGLAPGFNIIAISPNRTVLSYPLTFEEKLYLVRSVMFPAYEHLVMVPYGTRTWRVSLLSEYPGGEIADDFIQINRIEFKDRHGSYLYAGYGPITKTLAVWKPKP